MFEHAAGKKICGSLNLTTLVFTCSTGDVLSGAAINGKVVDRLGLVTSVAGATALGTRDRALIVEPFCFATVQGSTSTLKNVGVDIKLQHGDSSGGGDMADYTTQDQPVTAQYFGTAMTTDMVNWTTGTFVAHSNPAQYELTGAKRFLRTVGTVTKFGVSTSTGTDGMPVVLGLDFREFTFSNPNPVSTSSSTSTS
jgi:hypothetical protein